MTTIWAFPHGYFYRDKESSLSQAMVLALKKAFAKQKRKQPFGPTDIKRSLYPLIERDLIGFTYYRVEGEKQFTWYVTKKGMQTLNTIRRLKDRG